MKCKIFHAQRFHANNDVHTLVSYKMLMFLYLFFFQVDLLFRLRLRWCVLLVVVVFFSQIIVEFFAQVEGNSSPNLCKKITECVLLICVLLGVSC